MIRFPATARLFAAPLVLLTAALAGCGSPDTAGERSSPAPSARARADGAGKPVAALTPVRQRGGEHTGKVVALTFDADMTSDETGRAAAGERFDNPGLIDALRRLRVPATVFMTGAWADQYPRQARAIGRDPLFEVANHSYSHHAFATPCYGLPAVRRDGMRADVRRAFAAFRRAGVPHPVPYLRFPGGCYDRDALRALAPLGVTAVQWDVVSGDAFATDPGPVADEVLRRVRPGSVVVMHCTRSAAPVTEEAVRRIVPRLRERGYRFVKVSRLLEG